MADARKESAKETHAGRGWTPAIILPLVILAAFGLWFWRSQSGESAHANNPNPVETTLHLETFVLNLADTNQRSYLRVGVDLGLNQEVKRAEEIVPIAEVRDTILGVLGDAKVDDLLTASGKSKLKQDILGALKERIPQLGAEQVYFSEFLIQR